MSVSEFIDGREFAAFLFQSYNRKVYTVERVINLPGNPSTSLWIVQSERTDRKI